MSGFIFVLTHMQDIMPAFAVVGLLILLFTYLVKMSIPLHIPREFIIAAMFVFYVIINVAINGTLEGIPFIDFIKQHSKLIYSLAFLPLFYMVRPTAKFERSLYPSAIFTGFVISFVLILVYLLAPSFSLMGVRFIYGGVIRGPLGSHGPMAGSLGLLIILFFVAVVEKNRGNNFVPVKVNIFTIGMVITISIVFALAQSRGRTLGLLFIVFVLITPFIWDSVVKLRISLKGIAFCFLAVVMALLSVVALSSRLTDLEEDEHVFTRFVLWYRAMQFIAVSPLTGVGLGTFQQTDVRLESLIPGLIAIRVSGKYPLEITRKTAEGGLHSHNIFLQLLCELGLIGTTLFLVMLTLGMMRKLPARSRVPPEAPTDFDRVLGLARFNRKLAGSLFVFLCVSGMTTGYTLESPPACWLLYICIARFIRQYHYIRQESAKRQPENVS